MATFRSFTGYLNSDLNLAQLPGSGNFTITNATPTLNIVIQDNTGDTVIDGDVGSSDDAADFDQVVFAEKDGATLPGGALNNEVFYLEGTFTFTVAGDPNPGTVYTGYQMEGNASSTDFILFPPDVPAGQATITGSTFQPTPNSVDYDDLASDDETTSEDTASALNLSGDDIIIGGDGDDTIDGSSGEDRIDGNDGADIISGGANDDFIRGGGGADTIDGDAGNDTIYGDNTSGFDVQYYELGGSPGNLAAAGFDTNGNNSNDPTATLVRDDLNVGAISLENGGDRETYAVRFETTLNVTAGGDYTFTTSSDDGSQLFIDGVRVVQNDGLHGVVTRSGTTTLAAGEHNVVIIFFERGGGDSLSSTISGPDTGGTVIDLTTADIASSFDAPGADTIDGGDGDDVIFGQEGNDTIQGGAGDDTVSGGAGDDIINDSGGGGSFDGDAGDDTITVNGGVTTVTVDGGTGDDDVTIFNAVGSTNNVDLGDGNDTFTGGNAVDTVDGGAGDDTIASGAGNDVLDGGTGDDTFNLFTGNDTITGGDGFDTFTFGATSTGDKTITDFGTATGADNDDGDQTNNDFIDLENYYDNYFEIRGDLADDGILNQSNATDSKGRAVDYTDNTALPGTFDITGTAPEALTFDTTNVVCFAKGTLIKTAAGLQDIAQLKIGDQVATRDNGLQAIRWIGARTLDTQMLAAHPHLRPIRIAAGALGNGMPARDLVVSPQHRIVVRSKIAIRMFDTQEVFVIAKHLLRLDGVSIAQDMAEVTYMHLMCDAHEIIEAEGAFAETLHTGPEAMKSMTPAALEEITLIFGQQSCAERPLALYAPQGRQAKKLVERHAKNERMIYC